MEITTSLNVKHKKGKPMPKTKRDQELAMAAKLVAAAKPRTSVALKALFKSVILPILPSLILAILGKASKKTKGILIQVRNILNEAELGEN
jgi:hypothetical protein